MSFANLKRNRDSLDKLTKAIESTTQTAEAGSKDDTRFWTPTVDKSGNGMAIIRFLPAAGVDGEDGLPWVRLFDHGFQGPGGWYIDKCLTTLNEKCPVCEHNNTLWNSGVEANKNVARNQKRRLSYYANIYVVSDPSNPQNEGTIRLYKFGKKIFDKITEAMNPEFPDEAPLNPFDFWEGANFKLKIRNVEGYRNYDKSEFDGISSISESDDEIEAIWNKQHSLTQFLDEKHFKSYDELKKKFEMVMGLNGGGAAPTKRADETNLDGIQETPKSAFTQKAEKAPVKAPPKEVDFDDDDESLSYFAKLAED
jgi:hypothetical protein